LVDDADGVLPVAAVRSSGATAAGDVQRSLGEAKDFGSAGDSHGDLSEAQMSSERDRGTSGSTGSSKSPGKLQRIRSRMSSCFDDLFEHDPVREVTIKCNDRTFSVTMPGGSTVGDLYKMSVQKYRIFGGGRVGSARLQTEDGMVLNRFKPLSQVNTEETIILIVHEQKGGQYGSGCGCTVTSVCSVCAASSHCNGFGSSDFSSGLEMCDSSDVTNSCGRIRYGSSHHGSIQFDESVEVLE